VLKNTPAYLHHHPRPPTTWHEHAGRPLALQRAVPLRRCVFVNPDLSVIDSHKIDPATTKQAVKLIVDGVLDVWVYMDEEWLSLIGRATLWRTRRGVKFDAKVVASFTGAYLAAW